MCIRDRISTRLTTITTASTPKKMYGCSHDSQRLTGTTLSPEPFSNIAMSLLGDSVVPVSLWLSWEHPYVFFGLLAVVIVISLVLIWVLAKFLRQLARRVSGLFATRQPSV